MSTATAEVTYRNALDVYGYVVLATQHDGTEFVGRLGGLSTGPTGDTIAINRADGAWRVWHLKDLSDLSRTRRRS